MIAGRFTPGQTYLSGDSKSAGSVYVPDGITSGACIPDRRTRLPLEVQRQELRNVEIVTPDEPLVSQKK